MKRFHGCPHWQKSDRLPMILTPVQVIPPSPEIGASADARGNAAPNPRELPAGIAA
jgi:hypothetical protein